MKKIESYLPIFPGFYNTIFECDSEECEIEYYNEQNGTDLNWDDFNWDYREYHERMAKNCVNSIEHELKDFNIKIEFQKLVSPREYNFTNDSINVEYSIENLNQIENYLKDNFNEFEEYLKGRYTSRDGFTSFYSTDGYIWLYNYLNDGNKIQHCFGSILEFILTNEGYNQDDLYNSLPDTGYIEYEVI